MAGLVSFKKLLLAKLSLSLTYGAAIVTTKEINKDIESAVTCAF